MSLIGIKRLQQSIFQHAAASNRAGGAGGGSGYVVLATLADQFTGNINQTFTTVAATDITNSTATFALTRSTFLKVEVQVSFAVTGGIDFAYISLVEDGSVIRSALSGDGPKGYYTATILDQGVFVEGSHTFKLQGTVGAAGTTGKVLQAELFVYQLGA